ncbi:uncharacterized protein BJX67DRAFT_381925 [Aspergillus lucknowensis]|uniref:Uncharacterized protein n=1 Tax=Aspergillus lucknowensis TaxID=176173 RepID=A0ABR4LPE3_9EURO
MHPQLILPLLASALLSLSGSATTQAFERPHGIDSGNTLCAGACVPDPALLTCSRIQFRPQYGCFMCCLSDDDLDNLDETFTPLDDGGEDEEGDWEA